MTARLVRAFQDVLLDRPAVVSIGTFDGVHRGHRYLLEQARERAWEEGLAMVVITFEPCPAVVLRPDVGRYQISTSAQKLRLLKSINANLILLLTFTSALSRLTADQFMDEIEARMDLKELWFGADFRFGHDRGGDLAMLVERSRTSEFSLHVVSRRTAGDESISSSRVRRCIASGDVEGATPLLGYPFRLACNSVASGVWIGGGSCAVGSFGAHQLLPADGAYAVVTSTGLRTVATVAGSAADTQVALKVDGVRQSFEVEFVRRLASIDAYASDPHRWDGEAHTLLAEWRRPIYPPITS